MPIITYVIGVQGRHFGGEIVNHCSLKHMIKSNEFHSPENFLFVGIEAFPLEPYLISILEEN